MQYLGLAGSGVLALLDGLLPSRPLPVLPSPFFSLLTSFSSVFIFLAFAAIFFFSFSCFFCLSLAFNFLILLLSISVSFFFFLGSFLFFLLASELESELLESKIELCKITEMKYVIKKKIYSLKFFLKRIYL